jgi:hypothetical protein
MALTAEKIVKLRELADRGIAGEKQAARNILTKFGIDWRKPKESFKDNVKSSLGMGIVKDFTISIEYASDMVLLLTVIDILDIKNKKIKLQSNDMVISCTEGQSKQVGKLFYKHRITFNQEMCTYASRKINLY